jgi:hypothetical protein
MTKNELDDVMMKIETLAEGVEAGGMVGASGGALLAMLSYILLRKNKIKAEK